jgi:hypothetical protein
MLCLNATYATGKRRTRRRGSSSPGAAPKTASRQGAPASKAGPGQSPHNFCLADGTPGTRACDFAVFDENGAYVSDGTDCRYTSVGMVAVNLNQIWGGLWEPETDGCQPDYDHVQLPDWKTASSSLCRGYASPWRWRAYVSLGGRAAAAGK